MAKYSEKAQDIIEKKMHRMKYEDMPQEQKVAIAISEAREKGAKVPKEKKGPDIHCACHECKCDSSRRGKNKSEASKKWNK